MVLLLFVELFLRRIICQPCQIFEKFRAHTLENVVQFTGCISALTACACILTALAGSQLQLERINGMVRRSLQL